MKNSILKTTALFLAILSLASCSENEDYRGSDNLIVISRNLPDFQNIKAEDYMIVNIIQGPVQEIQITVNENLQDNLLTEVVNNTLQISIEDGSYRNSTFIVDIQIPFINRLEFEDNIQGEMNMNVETLDLEIDGASRLDLFGQAETLNLKLADSGNVYGFNFLVDVLNAELKDAAIVEITTNDEINGSARDAAKLRYRGRPSLNISTRDAAQIIDSN